MPQIDVDASDELIRVIQEEFAKVVTEEVENGPNSASEHEKRKKLVMLIVAESVRTQRLYFVIRSLIMGLISALLTLTVVWYLGTIDAAQAVLLGIFVFVFGLVASRLFDKQVAKASRKIVNFLDKHKLLKALILKRL